MSTNARANQCEKLYFCCSSLFIVISLSLLTHMQSSRFPKPVQTLIAAFCILYECESGLVCTSTTTTYMRIRFERKHIIRMLSNEITYQKRYRISQRLDFLYISLYHLLAAFFSFRFSYYPFCACFSLLFHSGIFFAMFRNS